MINPENLNREKLLFAYTSALEEGDFARLEAILELAQNDAVLERRIVEINAALYPSKEAAHSTLQSTMASLWQRIRSTLHGLLFSRVRVRPSLLSILIYSMLGIMIVMGVLALLGPAVGKTFQNAVSVIPTGLYPQLSQQATQNAASAIPTGAYPQLSQQATQNAGKRPDDFSAYPFPLSAEPTVQPASQAADRLIVRNASMIVVVNDTRLARQAVLEMITQFETEGAFVVSANETYPYNSQMPMISMSLRVPVKRYNESMSRLASLGIQVLSRIENAQDVTQDYVDTTARIEALQVSRARLLEIIKNAKNTEDLLRAEQELSRREAELESVKARQQNLEKTAALSSISLELRPVVTSLPVTDTGWNPAATLHNAVSALLANLRGLADGIIYFVIATLPWLVVIGLILFAVLRLIFRRTKK